MSETAFDGTLISDTSFETLPSEDLLAKLVRAIRTEKRRIYRIGTPVLAALLLTINAVRLKRVVRK